MDLRDRRTQQQLAGAAALGSLAFALYYRRRGDLGTALLPPKTPGALPTPQLEAALRDLYEARPDGSRVLLVPTSSGRIARVEIRDTKESTFRRHAPSFEGKASGFEVVVPPTPGSKKRPLQPSLQGKPEDPAPAKKVGVNKEFFRQLRAIFAIIIPRSTAKEVFLLTTHTFFLLLRTYLSLLVAKLDGVIVRDLVSADARGFGLGLVYWYLLAIPSTYTNSMIRYLQQKLAISFRTRLTRYVHDLYLSAARNYYKVINLDSRIEGADQFITTDVARFCDTLSSLYSNVSKPSLDLLLFNYQLGRSIGKAGSFGLFVSYVATAYILRAVTPAFGKLASVEAKLEGDFRGAHSRLITNAEEIAFYNGASLEESILNRIYLRLMRHVNSIFKIRIAYTMIEDFVIKYLWSATGYCLISIPVFFGDKIKRVAGEKLMPVDSSKVARRTENYISNRRLLLSLADAGGRLMYSYKELAELAGHTSRVYALLSTLHALNKDHFLSVKRPESLAADAPFYDLGHINGVINEDTGAKASVSFDRVPIVAPAPGLARGGEELVRELRIKIQPGEHLLITGPNGVGKTGIARVLAGLWPAFEGVVQRPESILFLPQRPYLSLGSLRDQIIYPHSYAEFKAGGGKDSVLTGILEKVHLAYLPDREGGFDTRKEWKDVLSGGEKQRMGMARLFYHKPRYGVLDECTSAVSTDVEGLMYTHAKELGITLITISHRPSLLKYHGHLLRLTGEHSEWELTQVGTAEEQVTFDKELAQLEEKLQDVQTWKTRLEEINRELAFQR